MAEIESVPRSDLPYFENGVLPPDDYPLTVEQLRLSHLVTGAKNPSKTWDRRQK